MNWERWARAAGAIFAGLTVASLIVGGDAPKVSDSTQDLISYYDGHRGKVLASFLLFGLGIVFLLWFAATLANLLRESGEGRVGSTVIAMATAFATLQLALTAVAAVLAYSVAGGTDTGVLKALFDLQWVLDIFSSLPLAAFVLATSLGLLRTHAVPSWLGWAGAAVAVLVLVRATNWASDGFWSPTGGYFFVVVPVALLWILVTSIVLVRNTPSPSGAPSAASAPTTV
jgi:hypothetical protein